MLNDLPQLFGKNFLLGFVLPSLLILAFLAMLCDAHGLTHIAKAAADVLARDGAKDAGLPVITLGLMAIGVWTLAVVLMGINYQLTRLLEGYGALNPVGPLVFLQRWRFRRIEALKAMKAKTERDIARQNRAFVLSPQIYPDQERLVLATRFGNVLRAAERYAHVVYAMDPIQLWMRLQPIVPQSQLDIVSDAKTSMDMWINLWFGALLVAAADLAAGFLLHQPPHWPVPVGAILAALAASRCAQSAAVEFGQTVKSTFDLHRATLADQLGLALPSTLDEEQAMWRAFSQTTVYRDALAAGDLDRFRKRSDPQTPYAPAGRLSDNRPVRRWRP